MIIEWTRRNRAVAVIAGGLLLAVLTGAAGAYSDAHKGNAPPIGAHSPE